MADNTEDTILKGLGEDKSVDETVGGAQDQEQDSTDKSSDKAASTKTTKESENEESSLDSAIRRASGEDSTTKTTAKGSAAKATKGAAHPQDLVDGKGNVIATGGRERRFYETAQREKSRADSFANQLRDAQLKIETFEKSSAIGTQLGLSPQELMTGAHIMASLKADPVAAAKYILTQVQAAGHNIEGIGGGVDMKALRAMLNEAMQPFTQEHEGRVADARARSEASDVYNDFISSFPDARIHDESLARLLESEPKLTPEAAYYKLRTFYLERGLDFTKPLDVLQKEIEAKGATQEREGGGGSIPSGGASESSVVSTDGASLGANARTDDIVRAAMKDAGMNVNF